MGRRVERARNRPRRHRAIARRCGSARRRPFRPTCSALPPDKFSVERGERNGRAFHMYHRETDAAKVAANRETIFDLHQQAIEWLETYTDRKYPFQKLDFVLLPAFQFGGMEHAGAIFYNAPCSVPRQDGDAEPAAVGARA